MDNAPPPTDTIKSPDSDALPNPELDLTGKTIGDFRILRRLGQGGMGQVYLAEQLSLKRKVALKIMRADLASRDTALQRFQLEAEAIAQVTHANIVQVYSTGVSDGLNYMALEYVEGRNLRDFVAKKGPPALPLALSIMRQVAAALDRAHEAGIIHRDIKPENILLTRKAEVKVADFGLSRCFGPEKQPMNITQSGVSLGTPLYMSPEQVQGKDVDPRTDIYSFGITCYHMLSGQAPFRGRTAFEVAVQHVQTEAQPLSELRPDLPLELAQLVHKMIAKDPAHRYQTSRELLGDIARLREALNSPGSDAIALSVSQPTPARIAASQISVPQVALPPRTKTSSRAWLFLLFVLTVALALAAGIGVRFWMNKPNPPTPDPAFGQDAVRITQNGALSQEAVLTSQLKKEFNRADPDDVKRHFEAAAALGNLYLQERRLPEAETFFRELREKPPHDFRVFAALGKVGHACVLAYQEKPEESNKLFVEIEKARPPFGDKLRPPGDHRQWMMRGPRDANADVLVLHHVQVRRMIAEALAYNAGNLGTETLSEPLEKLRHPPNPLAKPGPP